MKSRLPQARRVASALLVVVATICGGQVFGQSVDKTLVDATSIAEPALPEVTRDSWRSQVEQAKLWAKEIALYRRLHPKAYAPPPEDPAKIATQRVMRDYGLQPGDIVATDKGRFVFRGRPDQPHGDEDFVALPAQ